MKFLIRFDLPSHDDPQREFERKGFEEGRLYAKRMELTLRDHLKRVDTVPYFLWVRHGEDLVDEFTYAKTIKMMMAFWLCLSFRVKVKNIKSSKENEPEAAVPKD